MSADRVETDAAPSNASPSRRRSRSFLPRFGLRSLLIFAILFCLLCGWVGRRYYQVRQDEAAIEALQRAGHESVYYAGSLEWSFGTSEIDQANANWERLRRVLVISRRPPLESANLSVEDSHDPSAAHAIAAMRRFPEMRRVILRGRGFDDGAMKELKGLPLLDTLLLYKTNVTSAGLAELGGSERLETLCVTRDDASDSFAGLGKLKRLRTLELSGDAPLDRSVVSAIASLPKLESLSLTDVGPSSAPGSLMPLQDSRSLKHLSYSAYADAGEREQYPCIPNLEEIELYGLSGEAVARWPALPRLRRAELNLLEQEAARAFSAANPACDVTLVTSSFGPSLHDPSGASVHYRGGTGVDRTEKRW